MGPHRGRAPNPKLRLKGNGASSQCLREDVFRVLSMDLMLPETPEMPIVAGFTGRTSKRKRMNTMRWTTVCLATWLTGWAQAGEARRLTLDEMYRLADSNNRQLALLSAGIEAAEKATEVVETARMPKLTASVSASYLGDAQILDRDFGSSMTAAVPHFGNSFALEASQVIYAGGAITGGIEKARLETQVARLGYEKDRQSIRFLLASLTLDIWKLGNQRAVYTKNLEQEETLLAQMQARLQAGAALRSDVLRHELQLANLKLALIQIDDSRRILNNQLVTLLGLGENDMVEPDTTLLTGLPKDIPTQELLRKAQSDLPELKLAEASVQVARKEVEIAQSAWLPTVSAFAGDELNGPVTFEVPTIDKNLNVWFVGVGLKYEISSLYTAGRTTGIARRKEAVAARARDLAQEQATLAVRNGLIKYRQSFDELAVLEKGCEVARENYAVVDERYRNGVVLITEMMDASNARLDAELKLVNARINTVFQSVNLKRLTGAL